MDIEQRFGFQEPQGEGYSSYVKESTYNRYKSYFVMALVVLVLVSSVTVLELVYKSSLSEIKPIMLNIMMVASWFFGLTASGIIKYLLSVKRFENKPYTVFEREKNFIKFLVKIILLFLVTSLAIWLIRILFQKFFYFVHLFLVEWLLIVYVWFCIENKYKFPWFYTIIINIILSINAYYIHTIIYA